MKILKLHLLLLIVYYVSAYKSTYKDNESIVNRSKSNGGKGYVWSSKNEKYRNCQEILNNGFRKDGIYVIYPYDCCKDKAVKVYCDQTTDGGGWTVIQRRADIEPHEDFFRNWMEYALGFGKLSREFWLGLDNIHILTEQQINEIRFDITDMEDEQRHAKYRYFYVHSRGMDYLMEVDGYSGDAGDSFTYHNGNKFSTKDKDFDFRTNNCAEWSHGAWWYKSCYYSNLNGRYRGGNYPENNTDGVVWYTWNGNFYSHKKTEMKIRPVFPFDDSV